MLPLDLGPMLRSVLVRVPIQARAALPVMEPVMDPATGQETKGPDLKTAPALGLRNKALDSSICDIRTGGRLLHRRLPQSFHGIPQVGARGFDCFCIAVKARKEPKWLPHLLLPSRRG